VAASCAHKSPMVDGLDTDAGGTAARLFSAQGPVVGRRATEGQRLTLETAPDLVTSGSKFRRSEERRSCGPFLPHIDSVPIVALSRRGDGSHNVRALDLGADGFITKPFDWGNFSPYVPRFDRECRERTPPSRSPALAIGFAPLTSIRRSRDGYVFRAPREGPNASAIR
jgi:DNA-binding response OmpR family regulator